MRYFKADLQEALADVNGIIIDVNVEWYISVYSEYKKTRNVWFHNSM